MSEVFRLVEDHPAPHASHGVGDGLVVASIWAQDRHGVLGTGSDMCWHVPADFAHFKAATLGAPVLMGRASWEALGGALPGRTNIVITRSRTYEAAGARVVHSLGEALEVATWDAVERGATHVWVTGGGQVYAEAMEVVDELVVTDLDLDVEELRVSRGLPPVEYVHAPAIDPMCWVADPERSDADWRPVSGDARWRITTWVRR